MTLALLTLLITIAVETTIALILQWARVIRARPGRLRIDVPLVNLATHPLTSIATGSFNAPFALVETVVVGTELLLFRHVTGLSWRDAGILTVLANGTTIAMSFLA